jgi:hypothetical protein
MSSQGQASNGCNQNINLTTARGLYTGNIVEFSTVQLSGQEVISIHRYEKIRLVMTKSALLTDMTN